MNIVDSLLEAVPDAMMVINHPGMIVSMNDRMQTLFGYARDDLIGKAVQVLVPERYRDARPLHDVAWLAACMNLQGLRRDGTEFPIELHLSHLNSDQGTLGCIIIRDISERGRYEKLLNDAGRRNMQFISKLSSDLRTPLTGLMGFSELLQDRRSGELTTQQREYLADILACGRSLLEVVDRIGSLSPSEARAPTEEHAQGQSYN